VFKVNASIEVYCRALFPCSSTQQPRYRVLDREFASRPAFGDNAPGVVFVAAVRSQ
jgi:hypothetical protein